MGVKRSDLLVDLRDRVVLGAFEGAENDGEEISSIRRLLPLQNNEKPSPKWTPKKCPPCPISMSHLWYILPM